MPERPKGADCKSAGTAYGGSNPPRPTSVDENGEDHAYWRQYYGIDRQWTPRPGVRRGCLLGPMAALLIVVAVLIGGLVVFLVA